MPVFEITSPEGKKYQVTGPEGSTADQAIVQLQNQLGVSTSTDRPPTTASPSWGASALDFAKSIPRGILGGLSAAGSAGGQAAQIEMGQTVDVPDAQFTKEAIEKNVTGELPKPQGRAGRFGETVGEFIGSPTSYIGGGSLPAKIIAATIGGLGSEVGGQLTEGTAAEPYARVIGGAGPLAALSAGGKLLGAAGDKIMTSVIRPTARDIADGFSLDTVKSFKLGGSLNTMYAKTQAALADLSSQLRTRLAGSTQTINLSNIVDETAKELGSGSSKLKGFGANQKISSALDSLKEEAKLVGNNLSIPDAQLVKQASGAFGSWHYGRPDPDARAAEIVFNTFYSKLKTAIEKASPAGVKEINQKLGKLIPVNNAMIRRIPVADRNRILSLSDMVALAASTAHPGALGLSAVNLMQKSGAVGNLLSKAGANSPRASIPAAVGATATLLQNQPVTPRERVRLDAREAIKNKSGFTKSQIEALRSVASGSAPIETVMTVKRLLEGKSYQGVQ